MVSWWIFRLNGRLPNMYVLGGTKMLTVLSSNEMLTFLKLIELKLNYRKKVFYLVLNFFWFPAFLVTKIPRERNWVWFSCSNSALVWLCLSVLPGDQFFQNILAQNGLGMAIDIGGPEDGFKWCVSKSLVLEFSHIVEENADIFSFHSLIHKGM